MELGEGFDPFSSVQPVADWFNPPYGHVETVKALDLYKKNAKKILFGEVPAERKGERWARKAAAIFLNKYEGVIVTWTIGKFEKPSTFHNRGFYATAMHSDAEATTATTLASSAEVDTKTSASSEEDGVVKSEPAEDEAEADAQARARTTAQAQEQSLLAQSPITTGSDAKSRHYEALLRVRTLFSDDPFGDSTKGITDRFAILMLQKMREKCNMACCYFVKEIVTAELCDTITAFLLSLVGPD